MIVERTCSYCQYNYPASQEKCIHCARPAIFPNVEAAQASSEQDALQTRYEEAYAKAKPDGTDQLLSQFEAKVAKDSRAVIARSYGEIDRLAANPNEIYSTFYSLVEAGNRVPLPDRFNRLRSFTDDLLFYNYKEHIRFASLSLGPVGLSSFGSCFITLRDDMIAHRTSVFTENSVLWVVKQGITPSDVFQHTSVYQIPPGSRATWANRGKLAAAKLGTKIQPTMQPADFDSIITQEKPAGEDDFIEVHIWGPITVRAMESVAIRPARRPNSMVFEEALRDRLAQAGVTLAEVVS